MIFHKNVLLYVKKMLNFKIFSLNPTYFDISIFGIIEILFVEVGMRKTYSIATRNNENLK